VEIFKVKLPDRKIKQGGSIWARWQRFTSF